MFFIIYLLKNEAVFTSLISDVRIAMQVNMTDNQTSQNPSVRLFQSVYLIHICIYIFIFRTFDKENTISIYEKMLKKYDGYFIIAMMKQKILKIWFIYKIGMFNFIIAYQCKTQDKEQHIFDLIQMILIDCSCFSLELLNN